MAVAEMVTLSPARTVRLEEMEVKTGSAGISARERQVRECVQARRVEWQQLDLPDLRIRPGPAA